MNEQIEQKNASTTPVVNPIIDFLAETWPLAAFTAVLFVLFYFMGHAFSEFAYGALRFGIVMISAFAILTIVFKHTVRPYLFSGQFVKEFLELSPTNRMWVTIAVIALVTFVANQCFVHP